MTRAELVVYRADLKIQPLLKFKHALAEDEWLHFVELKAEEEDARQEVCSYLVDLQFLRKLIALCDPGNIPNH